MTKMQSYTPTPRTGEINQFLVRTSDVLTRLAEENTSLVRECAKLSAVVDTARVEQDMTKVAFDAARNGHIPYERIPRWVEEKVSSGKDPADVAELLRLANDRFPGGMARRTDVPPAEKQSSAPETGPVNNGSGNSLAMFGEGLADLYQELDVD
jgi:hypothetical protein